MTDPVQDGLFPAPPPVASLRALTQRQARAYELVRTTPGGITADELGAAFHADQGRHAADARCDWDARIGLGLMRSKALSPLVVRRQGSGRYQPRDGSGTPVVPEGSMQLGDLPGESFEDLFGTGSEAA